MLLYLRGGGRQLLERLASFCARPWAILLLALPVAVIEAALLVGVPAMLILRLAKGTAWTGLTSATGKYTEQHEVWSMTWQA